MNLTNLKQIIRHLLRRKFYTGINILGLGIGLGCVILMTTYVLHEFSYDRYHQRGGDIYRVIVEKNSRSCYAMGEVFKKDIPEIEKVCRLYDKIGITVKKDDNLILEEKIIFADPSITDILDIPIVYGNPELLLENKNSLMISQTISDKYFPGENPVGQVVDLAIDQQCLEFQISGVFKDLPSYSSFQTSFIGNIENAFLLLSDLQYSLGFTDEENKIDFAQAWEHNEFTTLLLLSPHAEKSIVEGKCTEICQEFRDENLSEEISLQSFNEMYLYSENIDGGTLIKSNKLSSLKIFTAIGLLILLVSIVNFVLISNADNNIAIREIACKKVNGASKSQILFFSLSKTMLISFISLLPAIIFVSLMLPLFNNFLQRDLMLSLLFKPSYIIALLVLTLVTGICAGVYEGAFIFKINPARLFQNSINQNGTRGLFNGLPVIIQFVVFILLTSSFVVMYKQYNSVLDKDIGVNSKNILVVNIQNDEMSAKVELLTNKIRTNPNVIECIPSSFMTPPTDRVILYSYSDSESGEEIIQEALVFGAGVIELLDIKLLEGRSFNSVEEGYGGKFILNKAAAKKYDIRAGDKVSKFDVIGVVDDFHFHSLHQAVEPIFIALQSKNFSNLLIKTNGNNKEVVQFARELCQDIAPSYFLEYELLDDRIENFYEEEKKQMGTVGFFSTIALLLSFMGLLGYVSLSLVKKTKEIGIRKINGAQNTELIGMVNLQYVKWVMMATTIACPLAYFAMTKWLEDFAYKTELSWWIFALVASLTLIIALITVSFQSWQAASKNPVEALRYE